MDRFRLIAEIRKRPALWDFQSIERSRLKIADLWREVASCVGDNVTMEACKVKWKHLRDAYRTEMKRSQHRIERDIRKGKYDPNKEYGSKWLYFEQMKFVNMGARPRTKDYKSNDEAAEEVGCDINNVNTQFHLGPPPLRRLNTVTRDTSPMEDDSDITAYKRIPTTNYYQLNFLEDSDRDDEMVVRSINTNRPGNETRLNDNNAPTQYALSSSQFNTMDNMSIKVEPDIDIEPEPYPIENEDSCDLQREKSCYKNSIKAVLKKRQRPMEKHSTPKQKYIETNTPSTKHNSEGSKILNDVENKAENLLNPIKDNNVHCRKPIDRCDPDSNFLISFSSHMKSMSQLQNLQFRAKMSKLILNIFSISLCTSASKKQDNATNMKEIVDISDPDCIFLISFLPHLNAMTQLQNLQFRAKMSDIMLNIMSNSLNANTLFDCTTTNGTLDK